VNVVDLKIPAEIKEEKREGVKDIKLILAFPVQVLERLLTYLICNV
jgi:hypothetical protein